MIYLKNVTKIYPPNTVALKDVTLQIQAGEFVSIVGQSGTGKSTLTKLLIAEEKVTRGSIFFNDWDITKISPREIPFLRRQIGVVFQDFKLLPNLTAYENVAFAMEVAGLKDSYIKKIVPQLLSLVNLEKQADRYPRQLSGGEQQRVVIARALVHRPKLVIADEPTGNLDAINSREIIEIFKKINDFGTTVILVTHNRDIVNHLKKRVVTLENGMVVSDKDAGHYFI